MNLRHKNVLVVEDENVLRASMVAGLAKLKDVQLFGAGTLSEAVATLDDRPPSVVVSDIDLPDGLGVQLIGELAKRQIKAAIIFVTAYRAAYGSLIPPHAGVEVLEKPVSLGTLRQVVSQRLGSDEVPSSPFTVADYVQLSCMGRHSVTIDVESKEGRGRIEIVEGALWSAVDAEGATGEDAFRRVAFRRDVKIQCIAAEAAPGERNLTSPWESVLMESARLQDEEARASRPVFDLGANPDDEFGDFAEHPSTAHLAVVPAAPETRRPTLPSIGAPPVEDPFDTSYDQAIAALMSKDYQTAVTAFARARELRPDDPKVNANLKRLREMGFEPMP
ncbi:MAG TPA: response regulator [Polyangiaceae bacterium]